MISPQMEEYLEAIGKLEERGEAVTTLALARECKVAPPTVTEMLGRLAGQELIHYEPRKEIALTEQGRRLSSSVIRRHRLWERFLHDVLGLKWDQVHDNACQLEHATSTEVEQSLVRAMSEVSTCPHGHAIPDAQGETLHAPTRPLSALSPQTTARITSVEEESAFLRRLAALGLGPGVIVQVESLSPDGDTLTLRVADRQETLGLEQAARIAVTPLSADEAKEAAGGNGSFGLDDLRPGETARIYGFQAGRGMVGRCLALGFTPGAEVRMVQNAGRGPLIVLVRDTRIALGRGEAQRILVTRQGNGHADAS